MEALKFMERFLLDDDPDEEEEDVDEDPDEDYDEVSEFIEDLEEEAELAFEELEWGCVLYEKQQQQQQQQKIITLLRNYASYMDGDDFLVQFWGLTKVEGSHHHLSTSHQPFLVVHLNKENCRYRKLCRNHVYVVDVEGDDEDEHLGGVRRAYRSKHLESSPDLRLYSTHQFPMRDQAARCCFGDFMAIPVFDSHANQCRGVLEILSFDPLRVRKYLLSALDEELQQPESEIKEMLELVVAIVPRLYLAQVWVPCQQCAEKSSNLGCMGMAYSISSEGFKRGKRRNDDVKAYLEACEFHNLQLDRGSFNSSNLCDVNVSISKNSLAHYAQRARISHSCTVSLQSLNNSNHSYLIQFFLQPKFRQDAYGDSSLHLLLKIMEMNLKSFKFVLRGQLLEESQKPYSIQHESIKTLKEISSYKQKISESEFRTYLKTVDSCFHRPASEDSKEGWAFQSVAEQRLLVHIPIKQRIESFMKNVATAHNWGEKYWIVQFWAPKMVENRCYLETSEQPYAVGCLAKGLASFRKKCTTHHYVVDEEAKEEELGPPGRVFRNGYREITPDLFHYTTKEFPIRDYAMQCRTRSYYALPIFDDDRDHKCVGVLEFLGFHHSQLLYLRGQMKAAELCSTHIDFYPKFLALEVADNTFYYRNVALIELIEVLKFMQCLKNIPQLHMANVWVPNGECGSSFDSNMSCMELVFSTNGILASIYTYEVYWVHVQASKGMIGMVLASENKSVFCQNLCEFGIADQPLSHFEMSERCDVCFAICLQSSYTGDILYVVEFFLYPGPASYEYLRSFLNFLLPIMKNQLTSFKMACGKELGEELVVEVIEFSEANKLVSSESEQPDVFPIKFKSVQYTQSQHQHLEEHQTEDQIVEERQTEEHIIEEQQAEDQIVEERQTEEHIIEEQQQQTEEHIVEEQQTEKNREKGKRKTSLHLGYELLKPYFGKKLKDVAEELGVGRSTIKRACRQYGIDRWPSKQQYNKNPSLFEREMQPSTSNLQPVDKIRESSDHVVAEEEEEAEKVIVKVKHEEDIIKFDSCVSLQLATLIEKVATRLKLEKGSFKLKYLDEDGDEILLTTDKDLQHCPRSRTATGKTCIQLFVRR